MTMPARPKMTVAQYLIWEQRQEERFDLVGGLPERVAAGDQTHGEISDNLRRCLAGLFKNRPCRVYGPAMRLLSLEGNCRYPDVVVDCGSGGPRDRVATEPALAGEVLTPSTEFFDLTAKLDEYQAIKSMRHILVLSRREARARIWTLWGTGWAQQDVEGLEGHLLLSHFAIEIPLAEIYLGVTFEDANIPP
jgi:Uma2 family endonuclease